MSAPGLLTDFYELTMAAIYLERGLVAPATFELSVRSLPPNRGFLVACGLEQALDYLEDMAFDEDAIGWLASTGRFDDSFLRYLRRFRFSGDVRAVPEGETVFAREPILEVSAPLPEAQLVESMLLNLVAFQTNVATKAARIALACAGRPFADFSLRRAHGADAAVLAARAAFVGGAASTSDCEAARRWGIEPSGTMAHSFVMAFGDENRAFREYAGAAGDRAVLLVDTFDTARGVREAVRTARERLREGGRVLGIRIDSGDLARTACEARRVLDAEGLAELRILLSGDLDEYRIEELVSQGAPADGFGVGTQLGTGGDVPALQAVYKLVEDAGGPRLKLSLGKRTLPGRKQVLRREAGGILLEDILALYDEPAGEGRPLLAPAMLGGRRVSSGESLGVIRERCRMALERLPAEARALRDPRSPRVRLSKALAELDARLAAAAEAASAHSGDPPP